MKKYALHWVKNQMILWETTGSQDREVSYIKRNEKLTFENWVTINGQPVKVSELPVETREALGNRVRKEPLKALGFTVDDLIKEEVKVG